MRIVLCAHLVVAAVAFLAGEALGGDAFPDLRPELKAPKGYTLTYKKGPDFYTWVLSEDEKAGEKRASGIGIYFGLHPDMEHVDKKTAKQVNGTVCSQKVSWWVEVAGEAKPRSVRRDVVITYNHGKGFIPLELHFWVWGPTEEAVAGLAKQLESLKFVERDK